MIDSKFYSDTLLFNMDKHGSIDMDGCCEEVDTFMFEGLAWNLNLLQIENKHL